MLNELNITSVLGYGAIGLGFLLALLTYNLLKRPQTSYTHIYVYESFCFALVLVGAALQYFASNSAATIDSLQQEVKSLHAELNTARATGSAAVTELQTTKGKLDSAMQSAQSSDANLTKAYEVMVGIAKAAPTSIANLQEVNRVLTGNYCSGGHDGQPLWNGYGPKTAALSTTVIGEIAGASKAIESIVPPKYLQTAN
jgi:ElaB/YqjD/DUF883 family membrane-anchored ribosome-binding protein